MKRILKYLHIVVIFLLLVFPQSLNAYDFSNQKREESVKRTRREIYELYRLYKQIVRATESSSQFGFIGYNGACSMVTVDGGTIPLEEYVAGVIKAESGSESDNPELLKAQAIASRSYLLASKKNASNCSVVNGESYQAYSKVDENNAIDKRYIDAALATEGQVVSRNNEIALTQYLSYPNAVFCSEDSSGWHVNMMKFADDPSSAWTWNGPAKATVLAGNNYASSTGASSTSHHWGMSQTIAGYLTRKENYTYEKVIDLFYGQPIASINDGNYTDNIKYLDSNFGKIFYYNQNDYADKYYSKNPSSSNENGGTIASHGCGPTSAAIVASSLLNRAISPVEMTQKLCNRGGCSSGGSYNGKIAETLEKDYNLKTKMTNNNQDVIDALGTNKALVIALMGPGTFTSGGHFIVLTGVNTQKQVLVADPNKEERNKWYPFNTIVEQRKAEYIIVTK